MAININIPGGPDQYKGNTFILVDLVHKALIANGLNDLGSNIKEAVKKSPSYEHILKILKEHTLF